MLSDSSFLKFVEIYDLKDKFLKNNKDATDEITEPYVSFLLEGYTISNIFIAVGTIAGYMRAVNTYYKKRCFNHPFDKKLETDAAIFLVEQAKFEDKPEQQESLHDEVLVHMMELSNAGHQSGFRRAIWL